MPHTPGSRAVVCACLAAATLGAACSPEPPGPSPSAAFAITSIFPASGPDSGSTLVRIYGHGFDAGSVVQIDSSVTPAVVRNSDVIDVTMPAHAAGFVDVAVTNASGATATQTRAFNYLRIDPPMVADLMPPTGALEGSNLVKITGTGFDVNTVVTIGGIAAHSAPYPQRTGGVMYVYAPPRAGAGPVEVTVTNLYGQTFRLPGGYTYALAETFDLNGVWQGEIVPHGVPGDHGEAMSMTIQNNVLVSVTCGTTTHTFSPPAVVGPGRISVNTPQISIAAQALSPIEASGSLAFPGCQAPFGWTAFK